MEICSLQCGKTRAMRRSYIAYSLYVCVCLQKCKMIADSTEELPVAVPHVSDEEDDEKPFGGAALREPKAITFSVNVICTRALHRFCFKCS